MLCDVPWSPLEERARLLQGWEAARAGVALTARGGGIGLAKRDYLARNLGETSVSLMRSLKRALDPRGILNPGKIFAP